VEVFSLGLCTAGIEYGFPGYGKRSLNANEPLMLYGAWRFIDWIAAYLKRACLSSEEILQSIHAKKIRLGV
jgi:hypothetical protein